MIESNVDPEQGSEPVTGARSLGGRGRGCALGKASRGGTWRTAPQCRQRGMMMEEGEQ